MAIEKRTATVSEGFLSRKGVLQLCTKRLENYVRNLLLTYLLSTIWSTLVFGLFIYHIIRAQDLWLIVPEYSAERQLDLRNETFADSFKSYWHCLCAGAACCLVHILTSVIVIFAIFTKRFYAVPFALLVTFICAIFTAWYLIDLIAFVLTPLRQSKDIILFEKFSLDENFFNTLENVFSCCGVVTKDGFVEHPSHMSNACRPDEGFTSKPHPHCNHVIGERIMKSKWAALALGPIIFLICYVVFFAYQWLNRSYQEMKSRSAAPIQQLVNADEVKKEEEIAFSLT